jgi:hypothetical protein
VKSGERYELVLDALAGDAPAAVRLRLLLKRALRTFGFRAVSVRQVPVATPTRPADATSAAPPARGPSGRRDDVHA